MKAHINCREILMKKAMLVIALVGVMVFSFAATAMADHSPDFYFDFQSGNGVIQNTAFQAVFPTDWNASFSISNGTSPHSGYSQSTALCEVCHAPHRAPTLGTGTYSTTDLGGTAVSSSRYSSTAWTAEASTQMLLRSSAARACIYCHVVSGAPNKMYGGDATLAVVGDTAAGWGQFYAHTTGCTGCHAVHGANTFKGSGVASLILKYQGVKNLGTIALKVQPEVYGTTYSASNVATTEVGSLYTSQANMINGVVSPTANAAGVSRLSAAITAQCTICHASYAVGEETINANYMNAELFQPGTWATANGATTKIWVGNSTNPTSTLPGVAGFTYTATTPSNMTGSAGSVILAYKNHPMNAGTAPFKGAGASAYFTSGSVTISNAGSSVCQSCHDAPETVTQGGYVIQSFPHYTPGYYKFMTAQNQGAFNTPTTNAQFLAGRQAFYSNGGKPAIMNDGYCTKCHTQVGIDY
jgi:cytochrome c553